MAHGPQLPRDLQPDALELCLRRNLGERQEVLVGYILAYPVDGSATAAILAGEITSAAQIDDNQVATTFASEDSYYISMVLGSDLPARASVMERCIQRVTRWMAAHPDRYVFAKRSTDDGEHWLRGYDFRPIDDRDGIWARDSALPMAPPLKRTIANQ